MSSVELAIPKEPVYRRIEAYFGVARVKFLALPVALAGLIRFYVAVNALNEYSDFRRGIDDPDERDSRIFHFLENVLILAAALVFLALGGLEWSYGPGTSLSFGVSLPSVLPEILSLTDSPTHVNVGRYLVVSDL